MNSAMLFTMTGEEAAHELVRRFIDDATSVQISVADDELDAMVAELGALLIAALTAMVGRDLSASDMDQHDALDFLLDVLQEVKDRRSRPRLRIVAPPA